MTCCCYQEQPDFHAPLHHPSPPPHPLQEAKRFGPQFKRNSLRRRGGPEVLQGSLRTGSRRCHSPVCVLCFCLAYLCFVCRHPGLTVTLPLPSLWSVQVGSVRRGASAAARATEATRALMSCKRFSPPPQHPHQPLHSTDRAPPLPRQTAPCSHQCFPPTAHLRLFTFPCKLSGRAGCFARGWKGRWGLPLPLPWAHQPLRLPSWLQGYHGAPPRQLLAQTRLRQSFSGALRH